MSPWSPTRSTLWLMTAMNRTLPAPMPRFEELSS